MQAAHPLVIAGARETGFYERNPWKRLQRTLILTYTITFGSKAEAHIAADRINDVHARIKGVDEITGKPYDALDPHLLLWVHACLVDSALLFEELTVGKLDDAGRQRFHEEQMLAAELVEDPARDHPADGSRAPRVHGRRDRPRRVVGDRVRAQGRRALLPPACRGRVAPGLEGRLAARVRDAATAAPRGVRDRAGSCEACRDERDVRGHARRRVRSCRRRSDTSRRTRSGACVRRASSLRTTSRKHASERGSGSCRSSIRGGRVHPSLCETALMDVGGLPARHRRGACRLVGADARERSTRSGGSALATSRSS